MPRPFRIHYPGAWYHIMNRGAGKRPIFTDAQEVTNRNEFFRRITQIHRRFQIEIHAYCLMGNHYHLLIRTPSANISRAMQHLNSTYTRQFNVNQKTDGPLFRGRFKSILVEDDAYLLRLSRYIHLNPVAAGLVKRAEHFHWSSYRFYLHSKDKPEWLMTDEILKYFDENNSRYKYRLFVDEGVDKETKSFYSKLRQAPILGSDLFKKTITQKYLEGRDKTRALLLKTDVNRSVSTEDIMDMVAKEFNVDTAVLLHAKSGRENGPRAIVIYLIYQFTDTSQEMIANLIGKTSANGVSKTCQRMGQKLAEDAKMAKRIEKIAGRIKDIQMASKSKPVLPVSV